LISIIIPVRPASERLAGALPGPIRARQDCPAPGDARRRDRDRGTRRRRRLVGGMDRRLASDGGAGRRARSGESEARSRSRGIREGSGRRRAARQDADAAKAEQAESAAKAAAASAAPPPPIADASRYDGAWVATCKCSAVGRAPPLIRSGGIVVRGGESTAERGTPGQPEYDFASGRVAADGTPVMTGNGIGPLASAYGRPYEIYFQGRRTGDRFALNGALCARTCDVEIARPGTASEPRGKDRRS